MDINNYLKVEDKTIHYQNDFTIKNKNRQNLYNECYDKIITSLDYFEIMTDLSSDVFINILRSFIMSEHISPFSNKNISYFVKNDQLMIWINNDNIYIYLHLKITTGIYEYWFTTGNVFILEGIYDLGSAKNVRNELLSGAKNFLS